MYQASNYLIFLIVFWFSQVVLSEALNCVDVFDTSASQKSASQKQAIKDVEDLGRAIDRFGSYAEFHDSEPVFKNHYVASHIYSVTYSLGKLVSNNRHPFAMSEAKMISRHGLFTSDGEYKSLQQLWTGLQLNIPESQWSSDWSSKIFRTSFQRPINYNGNLVFMGLVLPLSITSQMGQTKILKSATETYMLVESTRYAQMFEDGSIQLKKGGQLGNSFINAIISATGGKLTVYRGETELSTARNRMIANKFDVKSTSEFINAYEKSIQDLASQIQELRKSGIEAYVSLANKFEEANNKKKTTLIKYKGTNDPEKIFEDIISEANHAPYIFFTTEAGYSLGFGNGRLVRYELDFSKLPEKMRGLLLVGKDIQAPEIGLPIGSVELARNSGGAILKIEEISEAETKKIRAYVQSKPEIQFPLP